ncbi:hypothetical protein GEV33_011304 [Tenebrio molitor]|uniref:Tetraspanin n=1 Tax=Tenebrio molitor TaxID=7067 RepID=A0A8J6HCD9_TENMO|nr:hypothetical protein GEV33_011304 [Tenebrio molitor]
MEVFERGTVVMSVRYNESLQQEQNKHLHLGSLANWLHAKSLEFNYAVLWFKRQNESIRLGAVIDVETESGASCRCINPTFLNLISSKHQRQCTTAFVFHECLIWMIGASIFALCLWLRFEPGIGEFLEKLDAEEFYIGVYVLIVASIIIMIVAFIGCISALQESSIVLLVKVVVVKVVDKSVLFCRWGETRAQYRVLHSAAAAAATITRLPGHIFRFRAAVSGTLQMQIIRDNLAARQPPRTLQTAAPGQFQWLSLRKTRRYAVEFPLDGQKYCKLLGNSYLDKAELRTQNNAGERFPHTITSWYEHRSHMTDMGNAGSVSTSLSTYHFPSAPILTIPIPNLPYIGTQVVAFIFGLAGSAVLLDNSARDSHFQPRIRESMRRLIINAHHEPSRQTLAMIQEGITCCGADGASDYLNLKQPLPNECRDSVTGNPFYHGCVDELTWFFEQKCAWVAGLAMTVCFFHVINVVLATILKAALEKEEEQSEAWDGPRCGRPVAARTNENIKKVELLVLADRRIRISMIADEIGISEAAVLKILHGDLETNKLCRQQICEENFRTLADDKELFSKIKNPYKRSPQPKSKNAEFIRKVHGDDLLGNARNLTEKRPHNL